MFPHVFAGRAPRPTFRRSPILAIIPALACALACGDDGGTEPDPEPVDRLEVVLQPSATAASGELLQNQPVVQLKTAQGRDTAVADLLVTATIGSGGGEVLGETSVRTDDSGEAAFTNLVIRGTVGSKRLRFSARGFASAESAAIQLGPGEAAAVGIVTQPATSTQSGITLSRQPVVQIRDADGNDVADSVLVTVTIASGGGSLGGTLSVRASGTGRAAFTDLSISGTPGPRTLRFWSSGLTAAVSDTVLVQAGGH